MNTFIKMFTLCVLVFATSPLRGFESIDTFRQLDVFELEFASAPRISPDGKTIVYVRNSMDIMQDRTRSRLWTIDIESRHHQPLGAPALAASSPRWSPDGTRMAYVAASDNGTPQIYCRWMKSGQSACLTALQHAPSNIVWSPDGKNIAFTMHVKSPTVGFASMPPKPSGAEWAPAARVVRRLKYRQDGAGFVRDGFQHLFVIPAEGGTPRQITRGDFEHNSLPAWSTDSKQLLFSANRNADAETKMLDTDLFLIDVRNGEMTQLTDRNGPDAEPTVSPDGQRIAYVGFDDTKQGYRIQRLYTMNIEGGEPKVLVEDLDRSVASPVWSSDGRSIVFRYDDRGITKLGRVTLDGDFSELVSSVGGTTIGRPYSSGSFTVSSAGHIAFTINSIHRPADVALFDGSTTRQLTELNEDLLSRKTLGDVEEIIFKSSFDEKQIQAWVVKPPHYDDTKKYPLILEIHGGPFANYGPRFSTEMQLYAAAGYMVLYVNPRGSTSYGENFGNAIHHAYPGHDYDDLMSAVDTALAKYKIDEEQLFVTGGSGGGVLSAWIVGKTDRFRAAVAAKPVINWYSFALTADSYGYFYQYWFPAPPWEQPEHYLRRSPISLVGNVKTPTMLITGENDLRTPISETEQFYQALKIRGVSTMMVRIPGASHNIAGRPSHLISKVAHVLAWFERYASVSP